MLHPWERKCKQHEYFMKTTVKVNAEDLFSPLPAFPLLIPPVTLWMEEQVTLPIRSVQSCRFSGTLN